MAKRKSKKTSEKKSYSGNHDFAMLSFVLGILSIVFAFMNSFAGLILGIIGITQSKKQKNALSEKARKLNIAGIIISAILVAFAIFLTIKAWVSGGITQFPTA